MPPTTRFRTARVSPPGNGQTNGHAAASPRSRIGMQALSGKFLPENPRIDELADKMDEDYQISLVRRAIESHVQAIPVTFSVEGDAGERPDAFSAQLASLWEQTLPDCMDAIARGRVAFEKVFDYDDENNLTIIRKFDALPFKSTRMKLDDDGCFAGIEIQDAKAKWQLIPPEKSWWLAINPTALNPHGTGLYVGAPAKTWKTRQEAARLRDKFLRRFVLGWILIRCRPTTEDENGQIVDNFDKMLNAVDDMLAGGAMAMSNEQDPTTNNFLETVENVGDVRDAAPLENTIDGMDAEQVRAFGFSEKVLTEGAAVGSYAMVAQQSGLLYALCLGLVRQIATSFQRYVVDKLAPLNFGASIKVTVVYPRMTEQQQAWIIDLVKGMVANPQLSPLVLSGAIDVRQILEMVGIPLVGDAAERLEAFIQQQQELAVVAATGHVAGQGFDTGINGEGAALSGPTAEFGDLSRRQYKRNKAAIDDALNAFAAGEITEARARVDLRSIGLAPENIDALIEDASDGTIDRTLTRRLSRMLAARRVPKSVITRHSIEARALKELERLKAELRDVVAAGAKGKLSETKVLKILNRMRQVGVAATVAAHLVGMVSPWKPSLASPPAGSPSPKRLPPSATAAELSLPLDGTLRRLESPFVFGDDGAFWQFPWLNSAVNFLRSKEIATDDEFKALGESTRTQVISAPGVTDTDVLARIRDALAESAEAGETRQQFATRIDKAVSLTNAQMETLFRTNTHQAYIAGQEATLSKPVVAEAFPFAMVSATHDTRTRPEHKAMDGVVVRRGTPEHALMLRLLADYGCRCAMIPLTEEDVKGKRVRTMDSIPASVRQMYA